MARAGRKAAVMEMDAAPAVPERIYHAAAYVRLSIEDNSHAGDRDSIDMQQYVLEKYIAEFERLTALAGREAE